MDATALDAQNGLVPLGIMVCRAETIENWTLFLQHLAPYIIDHKCPIKFISDRQKGLHEAVPALFGKTPHRYCYRHLSKNFKKKFKGYELQSFLWNAAKYFKKKHFYENMELLKNENGEAFMYLIRENPESWSRAFFDSTSKCEHMNNNFAESFNSMICNLRDKPICMLGMMYGQLVMGLFYKRRTECAGWKDGQLVPTAVKLFKKMTKLVGKFKTVGCVAGEIYSVTNRDTNKMFTVNIINQVCSCEQWQMRGFPCQHAVCALKKLELIGQNIAVLTLEWNLIEPHMHQWYIL